MILVEFRPMTKNTLRGFATVELGIGIIICDISVHTKNRSSYALMPSKPQVENGIHKTIDGKAQYIPVIRWASRERSDKFSEELIRLVKEAHPSALS